MKTYNNHNELIEFYNDNGIEIDNNTGYVFDPKISYIIEENKKLIGAITISDFKDGIFIEAIAISKDYRNKGIGKELLNKVIKENNKIFLVSKLLNYFEKFGFKETHEYNMLLSECEHCEQFKKTCFPKVMLFKK